MTGLEFEKYCANLLRQKGFNHVKVTKGSGDQGVDIIAYKGHKRYAIQCKYYSNHVPNKAVQEVFAGKTFYNCTDAIVMTNNTFTKSAIELAKKNNVKLWPKIRVTNDFYSIHKSLSPKAKNLIKIFSCGCVISLLIPKVNISNSIFYFTIYISLCYWLNLFNINLFEDSDNKRINILNVIILLLKMSLVLMLFLIFIKLVFYRK